MPLQVKPCLPQHAAEMEHYSFPRPDCHWCHSFSPALQRKNFLQNGSCPPLHAGLPWLNRINGLQAFTVCLLSGSSSLYPLAAHPGLHCGLSYLGSALTDRDSQHADPTITLQAGEGASGRHLNFSGVYGNSRALGGYLLPALAPTMGPHPSQARRSLSPANLLC